MRALFEREGEWGFRRVESEVVREQLASTDGRVLALGGGALLDRALRREALDRAVVVVLSARATTLYERIASEPDARPLLRQGGLARLESLLAQRREAYAEAHACVDAEGLMEDVLARILEALREVDRERIVPVALGSRTYAVRFASLASFADRVRALEPSPSSAMVVTDANAVEAPGVRSAIEAISPRSTVTLAGVGDAEKHLPTAARLWDAAIDAECDRRSVLCAIGGGVVSDVTGFVAATLLRGVRYASAPTTVLSIADASVGGKTAIDHRRAKNLIGAFHQPSLVLCDTRTLETLPDVERRSGLAEVVKVAAIADAALFAALERDAEALRCVQLPAIDRCLPAAVRAKARIVTEDEREDGARTALNFGHTLGHAIEQGADYALPHGYCVALGMRAAVRLGAAQGLDPQVGARIEALLDALDLPKRCPTPLDRSKVEAALARDKKRAAERVRFVLCPAIGASVVAELPMTHVLEALGELEGA